MKKMTPSCALNRSIALAQHAYFAYGLLRLHWSPNLIVFGYLFEGMLNYALTAVALFGARGENRRWLLALYLFTGGFMLFVYIVFFVIIDIFTGIEHSVVIQVLARFISALNDLASPQFTFAFAQTVGAVCIRYGVNFVLRIPRMWGKTAAEDIIPYGYGPLILTHFILFGAFASIRVFHLPVSFAVTIIAVKLAVDWFGVGMRVPMEEQMAKKRHRRSLFHRRGEGDA